MRSRFGRLILTSALVCLTGVAHGRIPADIQTSGGETFVPRPDVAQLTALGFDAMLADFYWLQAIQIVGGDYDPERHNPLLGALVDVVTTLDPWVDHPYRFAGVWLTDSEANVRTANRLLERGIEHHPDDWRNRFYLGFNHFFYLGDDATAAEVLEGAIALPRAPNYLRRLVARLKSQHAGLETAEAFLVELIRGAPDERTRAGYEKALEEIETERRARVLDKAREVYQRRMGRDIESVDELVQGMILRRLPPEPHGAHWELDEETGRIVSSHYGHRYEPQVDSLNRKRLQKLREGSREAAESS